MAIITDKPEGLPGMPNDLDQIPDDLLATPPAQVMFGNQVLDVMDTPPEPGEFLKVELTLRCRADGREMLDGGEMVHVRRMKFIAARVTTKPYKPAEDEPPPAMFTDGGEVTPEAVGEPQTVGEIINGGYDESGLDEFAAVRPAFSDAGK